MLLKNMLLDLLFPPRCPFCGKLMPIGSLGICERCAKNLPYVEQGKILRKVGKHTCAVTFYYEDMVRSGIHALSADVRQLSISRSSSELLSAIRHIQKAIEYAQGNVSVAAICGYLLWALQ